MMLEQDRCLMVKNAEDKLIRACRLVDGIKLVSVGATPSVRFYRHTCVLSFAHRLVGGSNVSGNEMVAM